MKKNNILRSCIILTTAIICVTGVYGCGEKKSKAISYNDGSYDGESSPDEWGGVLKAHITIKEGKISEVSIENLDGAGNEKGEDYGKQDGEIKNEGLYRIAQEAVKNTKEYPLKLMETQNIDDVDTIAGATVSNKAFKEAVNAALKDAK